MTPESEIKRLTPTEFATRIRSKYPQYKDLSDEDLTERILNKYPKYRTQVHSPTRPRNMAQAEAEVKRGATEFEKARNAVMSAAGRKLNPPATGKTEYFRPLKPTERAAQKRGEPVIISEAGTEPQLTPVAPEMPSKPRVATQPPVSLGPVIQGRLEQIQQERRKQEAQAKVSQARLVRENWLTQALRRPKAGPDFKPTFGGGQTYREWNPRAAEAHEKPGGMVMGEFRRREQQEAKVAKEIRPQVIKDYFGVGAGVRQELPPEVMEQQIASDPRLRDYIEAETQRRAKALEEREMQVSRVERGIAPQLGLADKIRNLRDKPEQLVPFLSSIPEINNLIAIGKASEKLEKGEDLTTEEIVNLREFIAASKQDKTFAYQVADVVSALPAFAGEFALTGGIYTAGKKAALKGLEKLITKKGLAIAEKQLATRLAVKVGTGLVGAAAQTLPASATRIPAGVIYREQGGASFGEALRDTLTEQFIEVASERAGGILSEIPLPKKLSAIRDAVTSRWLEKVPGRTVEQLRKIVEKSGWHGPLGEIFEERVGDVAKYGAGLQPSPFPTLQQLAVEGLAFSVPSVGMAAASRIGAGRPSIVENYLQQSPLSTAEEKAAVEKPLQVEQPKALPENLPKTPQNITETITKSEQVPLPDQKPEARAEKPSSSAPTVENPLQFQPDQIAQPRAVIPETIPTTQPSVPSPAEVKTHPSATESPLLNKRLSEYFGTPTIKEFALAEMPDVVEIAQKAKTWREFDDSIALLAKDVNRDGPRGGQTRLLARLMGDHGATEIYEALHSLRARSAPVTPAPVPTKTAATESQLTTPKEVTDEVSAEAVSRPAPAAESVKETEIARFAPSVEEPKQATIPAKPKETKPAAEALSEWGTRLKSIAQSKNLDDLQALSDEMAAHKDDPRVARLRTSIQETLARARQAKLPEQQPTPQKLSKTAQRVLAEAETPEGKTVRPAPTHRIGAPVINPARNSVEEQVRAYGGVKDDADQQYKGEISRLKESSRRGTVNQTGGVSVEEMATKLAQDGYGQGVWWEGAPNNVDPQAFLQALTDDARGSQKHYSSGRDIIEDDPDVKAWDALTESDAGKELVSRVESRRATARDIVTLTREAQANGLSDQALDAFLASVQRTIKEELPRRTQEGEGYTLDENDTLIDPEGNPLFARQLPLVADELVQEETPRPKEVDQRDRLRREQTEREEAADPARAAARRVLDELKRRGLSIDEYARQGVLFGAGPTAEEIQLLKEVERGRERSKAEQAPLFAREEEEPIDLGEIDKPAKQKAPAIQAAEDYAVKERAKQELIEALENRAKREGVDVSQEEPLVQETAYSRRFDKLYAEVEKEHPNWRVRQVYDETVRRMEETEDVQEIESDTAFSRAFHGSPYEFEKFSTEKIGTGEGAQSYGYGLYFTDRKEIAEHYRKQLTTSYAAFSDGRPLRGGVADNATSPARRAEVLLAPTTSEADARRVIERDADYLGDDGRRIANAWLKDNKIRWPQKSGKTYEVELAPKKDEYLLWDKPLSEQSEKVRSALSTIGYGPKALSDAQIMARARSYFLGDRAQADAYEDLGMRSTIQSGYKAFQEGPEALRAWLAGRNPSSWVLKRMLGPQGLATEIGNGEQVYRGLSQKLNNQQAASEYLHSLGIRGIKYLDQGSRNVDEDKYEVDQQGNKFWGIQTRRSGVGFASTTITDSSDFFDTRQEAQDWVDAKNANLPKPSYNYVIFSDQDVDIVNQFARGKEQPTTTFAVESNRVSLGKEGAQLLSDAYRESGHLGKSERNIRGTFEKNPERLAKTLLEMAASGRAGALELANAVQRAAKAGEGKIVLYATEGARKHEVFHETSSKSNRYLQDRHSNLDSLTENDTFSTMYRRLTAMGYDKFNMPALVEEAAAYIAEGRYDQLGITREEAVEWMYRWFKSFEAKNPNVNPREFQELANEAHEARERAYTEAARRQQVADKAIPSVQERREGRDRESIAAARETGETPLTERQFYGSYYQHKVLRKDADLTKLKEEGWSGGIGPQALPAYRGGEPTNVVDRAYGVRKGDTIVLVPKEQTVETPNGTKIKKGWRPTDAQIVEADRDYQPAYELYLKGLQKDPNDPNILMARSEDEPKEYDFSETDPAELPWSGLESPSRDFLINVMEGGRLLEPTIRDIRDIDSTEKTDPAQVEGLKDWISNSENDLPSIVVERDADNRFYVVDGHHRLQAAKELGYEKIPVIEHEPAPDPYAEEPQFARSEDPWADLADLADEFEREIAEISYEPETKYHQAVPEVTSIAVQDLKRRDEGETAQVSNKVAAEMDFSEPIEVSLFSDGEMRISDGHHRVAAARQRGIERLPVKLRAINARGKYINKLIEAQRIAASETKQSKLAAGVEAKAIEAKLTTGFQGLPEYETVKVADQARMAAQLLLEHPQTARWVALGRQQPPDAKLLPESVFIAVENDALQRGDVELLKQLATSSSLSLEATGMGQRIRMLAERNPYSPVTAMKEIQTAREKRAKQKMGAKYKEKVITEIKTEVRKKAPKAKDWRSFLEEIKCR